MDCGSKNGGCNKGDPWDNLIYAKKGVELDSDYPYVPKSEPCKADLSKAKVTVEEVYSVEAGSINALKAAIAQ